MKKVLTCAAVLVAVGMLPLSLLAGCGPGLPLAVKELSVVSAEDFDGISRGDLYEAAVEALGRRGTRIDEGRPPTGIKVPEDIYDVATEEDGSVYAWRTADGDVLFAVVARDEIEATGRTERPAE